MCQCLVILQISMPSGLDMSVYTVTQFTGTVLDEQRPSINDTQKFSYQEFGIVGDSQTTHYALTYKDIGVIGIGCSDANVELAPVCLNNIKTKSSAFLNCGGTCLLRSRPQPQQKWFGERRSVTFPASTVRRLAGLWWWGDAPLLRPWQHSSFPLPLSATASFSMSGCLTASPTSLMMSRARQQAVIPRGTSLPRPVDSVRKSHIDRVSHGQLSLAGRLLRARGLRVTDRSLPVNLPLFVSVTALALSLVRRPIVVNVARETGPSRRQINLRI
ncbi:hypothetical protein CBL_07104 [Carabus blaptoides fortunei]